MIKVYFKNAGTSGSTDAVEYPNADGYAFKDSDWITIKAGTETVAVIAVSAIQRIEGDVGEHKSHYRPQSGAEVRSGYGILPFPESKQPS
jgi:hypothetical protein